MITVYHFDNQDHQLGVLQNVSTFTRDFEINADRTVEIITSSECEKEDRIVFRDPRGRWHEYIIVDVVDDDTGEGATLTCQDSIIELGGDYIENKRPTGNAAQMLDVALEVTRWESAGAPLDGEPVTQVWYHTNARAAIDRIAATFGGEIYTEIEVEGSAVVKRRVGILPRLGANHGRRFEYARDLLGVKRERGIERIYTRVYGYGSGVPIEDESGEETGGYSRRITFGSVNGGKDYVESEEALQRWGRPDGKGGLAHVQTKIEFDDCEDPTELLRLTTEWAEAQYNPQMTYTANVLDFEEGGLVGTIDEGDDVAVIDHAFTTPLRILERVVKGHIDYLQPENTEYTLGRAAPVVVDDLESQEQKQNDLSDRTNDLEGRAPGWDEAADTVEHVPSDWLQQVMDRLNQEFENGGSYKFESFKQGTIYSSVPLDENGKPTKTPATALQLTGLGFRIASTTDASGNFVWTTFGTGEGFTANVINVGILRAGENYIDLDHGEVHLAASSTEVGSQPLNQYVQGEAEDIAEKAIDDAMTQEKVFNTLTDNGRMKGLYMQGGELYLNATYIQSGTISANMVKAGILTDQAGNVAINLNTGHATLKDIEASGSFTCGTAQNGMRLTSDGKLAGYKNGTQVGYINYAAEVQTHAGMTLNGLFISGGAIGFDIQAIYVKSGGTIYNATDGSRQYQVVRNVTQSDDKTITLSTGTIYAGFTHGICTAFDVL